MNPKRVSLIEDEPDISAIVKLHLEREGYTVTSYETGVSGLAGLFSHPPDLAIVDWMLPELSGLEVVKRVSTKFGSQFPILMLTARGDTADIVRGLTAGADDYLVKPFEIPVLLARVHALLRRSSLPKVDGPEVSEIFQYANLTLDNPAHEAKVDRQSLALTRTEFRILSTLLQSAGRVITREQLIQKVVGPGINVGDRTIDTHVFALRKKLAQSSEKLSDIIETIRGVGYRIKAL